jgi:putative DNA primase/helicase
MTETADSDQRFEEATEALQWRPPAGERRGKYTSNSTSEGGRAQRGLNAPLTEDSAAIEFAARYGETLRYCHDRGSWYRWDGAIWRPERTNLAFHYARELARDLSKSVSDRDLVIASKTSFAAGVERFARADRVFARTAEDWDQDPMLAGCPDGVLDLRTGEVNAADPALGITKSLAVAPAAKADCPRWTSFLNETFGGDEGLVRFVQQFLGYSLTGDVSEHALLYGYGAGGNGKSVLLNTVMGILGDYALTAAMDTFTASKSDKHTTDLARLHGARFVTASEVEEGRALAESRIKQLTGGDRITARFMCKDNFEFKPAFKLFLVGNHRPTLHSVDDAIRRRFNIVPFNYKPAKPEPDLEHKLRQQWPAILRWMVEGCVDWHANRLIRPDTVVEATNAYFADQDLFAQWLEDKCDAEPGNEHKWERSGDLFANWKLYATEAGEHPGATKTFAEQMRRRGFESHRGAKGMRQFRGVQFREARVTGDAR